jgi:hypothetical protein
MTRKCKCCGAEFEPKTAKGVFCSRRCKSRYRYCHRPGGCPSVKTLTCRKCGTQFQEPMHRGPGNHLCPECRKPLNPARESARHESTAAAKRRAEDSASVTGIEAYHIRNYTEAIMAAKKKPEWCSDARWRIELSRRADSERFEFLPENPFKLSL